jgi:hypothetical protein
MSVNFRRDGRSVEVFQKDIEDYTEREMYWGTILRYDFIEKGKPCVVKENGVDNSGRLIEGRLPNHNVDKHFEYSDGTSENIEIKTIPEYVKKFFTFKVFSLNSCVQQNASIIVPRSWAYYKIPTETCEHFYNDYPHKIYPRFSENYLAVRVYMDKIEELISKEKIIQCEWTSKAKKLIKLNYNILFRERSRA